MELKINTETAQCPSCQGKKTIHWDDQEYPCLLCGGTGEIVLTAPQQSTDSEE